MPPENTLRRGGDRAAIRRKRIIDVARALFIKHGFHSTGMALIANHSKVAMGQVYRDFASKEDIIAAIVEMDRQEYINAPELREAIATRDASAANRWIKELLSVDGREDNGRLLMEIVAEVGRNPRIAGIFFNLGAELRRWLVEALAIIAPGAHLEDRRETLADTILAVSIGLMHHRLGLEQAGDDSVVSSLIGFVDREIALLRSVKLANG